MKQLTLEKKNKNFINNYTKDFWNQHNLDAFDQYFTADFKMHMASQDQDRDQYKALCQAYFHAFPDLHITTEEIVAEGDKVTKIWTARCTHQGEFMGIPPSGNHMEVKGIEVFRIAENKISELWASMDSLGMMQQMGAIPAMTEA